MAASRPNILLFINDQQRRDTLGFRGETACRTPNMDRMAQEGVSFDQAMTTAPLCTPARASMFTGLYPHQTGMALNPEGAAGREAEPHDGHEQSLQEPIFMQQLRSAGYRCYYSGKWHLGYRALWESVDKIAGYADGPPRVGAQYSAWCHEQGIPDGVLHHPIQDNPYRSSRYPNMTIPKTGVHPLRKGQDFDAWIVNHTLDLLESRDPGHPFFLVCSLVGPHPPLVVPKEYYNLYDPAKIPEPINFNPGPGEPEFLEASYFRAIRNDWGTTWDAWQQSIAVYWAYITYIDELYGKVLERLEQERLLDETLIVMITDHGVMNGQHGLHNMMCSYEEAVRVPFLMRLPAVVPPGWRCAAPVSHIDLAPTILSVAEISPPTKLPGINLLELTGGPPANLPQRDIFSEYCLDESWDWHKVRDWRLMVRGPWKFVFHDGGEEEFYNLEEDPWEMENQAGTPSLQPLVKELREALLDWMVRTRDPLTERARPWLDSRGGPREASS
jgi:arylsulfatase A-like enzyme